MAETKEQTDDVETLMASLDQLGMEADPTSKEFNNDDSKIGAPSEVQDEKELLEFLDQLENDEEKNEKNPIEEANEENESVAATSNERQQHDASNQPSQAAQTTINKNTESATPKTVNEINKSQEFQEHVETPKQSNWLGGFWSTASAAVRSAEQRVRSIKGFEENANWDINVRNMVDLNKLGDLSNGIRSKALPTLSNTIHNVLNVVAPPIHDHEVLQVTVFHDLAGFAHLDRIVYESFEKVMFQVEGGELTVLLDKEAKVRPRTNDVYEDFGLCNGYLEAKKLAKANLAEPITEAKKMNKENKQENVGAGDDEDASESPMVRVTHLLLVIQAFTIKNKEVSDDEQLCFLIHLNDTNHNLEFSTTSQPLPLEWQRWAVDPRYIKLFGSNAILPNEWVTEWVEQSISVAAGIVAQMYTSKRMALGDPSLFAGLPEEDVNTGSSETPVPYYDGAMYA
ncbi:Golgi protein, associated with COP vesicles (predicted), DUF5427 [Schizosaccharomyces pombe]|uniref:Maintenance of telomere capping protein 1 n=1 Tax=Schizosaccharomyces pombe (strain 972 / ATCC 24843) TaxID=284812 RepID=MTC1_SCHPO|nr:uncharacterized protein SPCC1322.09 [Schizosaccharomyces pombe]O94548.1 RecName: Full=Maintenance of telomere capping protein 1 [Schizosaccharomyces pombe 972h-]CAA22862.1 conserved fungal protein [Schizosaccharomyces pombe]|eukprot:NP_588137.1 uncharacterized protein SPCC1322.09 [Schizosaccharomyces pombe]